MSLVCILVIQALLFYVPNIDYKILQMQGQLWKEKNPITSSMVKGACHLLGLG